MRKRDSRRRWKARYRIGMVIPWFVVEDHKLRQFVTGCEFLANVDAVRRRS